MFDPETRHFLNPLLFHCYFQFQLILSHSKPARLRLIFGHLAKIFSLVFDEPKLAPVGTMEYHMIHNRSRDGSKLKSRFLQEWIYDSINGIILIGRSISPSAVTAQQNSCCPPLCILALTIGVFSSQPHVLRVGHNAHTRFIFKSNVGPHFICKASTLGNLS